MSKVTGKIHPATWSGGSPRLIASVTSWTVTSRKHFGESDPAIDKDGTQWKTQLSLGTCSVDGALRGRTESPADHLEDGRYFVTLSTGEHPYLRGVLDLTFVEQDVVEGKRRFVAHLHGENQFQL